MNSVTFEIKTAEGETVQTVGVLLFVNQDVEEQRAAVEELAAELVGSSGVEPVIEEKAHPGLGGGAGGGIASQFVDFAVQLTGVDDLLTVARNAVYGGVVWAGVQKLAKRFGAKPAGREVMQMIELQAQRTAGEAIKGRYGTEEHELTQVSSSFSTTHGQLVYRGKDGSTFIVNFDGETGLMTGVARILPEAS